MVDMFLDPVMVGAAGREVRRSPRGGAAGLEPRRITGEGRGRNRKFAGVRDKRKREAAWTGLRVPGSAEWGERRSKQRSSAPRGARPAPPPRAEPTTARGLLELRGPRARALYRARERGSG